MGRTEKLLAGSSMRLEEWLGEGTLGRVVKDPALDFGRVLGI